MYRLYLIFCVISAVFGDSHEAKYIDLLPEQEKQEFLNRIARRIIQEIQNKDSPEQSQAEVSDDQLNQHNDYVRDLIKEESENMRSKRRDNIKENKDNIESSSINHELEKEKLEEKPASNENNRNIDLTLREDKHSKNNEIKVAENSTINVIPVKVLYDDDYTKSYQSTTDNSKVSNVKISSSSDNNDYTKTDELYNNNTEVESDNATDIIVKFSDNVENVNGLSREQGEVKENLEDKSVKSQLNTETPLVVGSKKETKYGDIYENAEASTNSDIYSYKYTVNHTQNDIKLSYSDSNLLPLTVSVKDKIKLNSNENPTPSLTSPESMISTTRATRTENLNEENENKDSGYTASSNDVTDQNKSLKSREGKKYLRKQLDNFSSEKRLQNENSRKKNMKKQYFVYEVSEENPLFVQKADSKVNEQPYVVPIYNFAPKNAYYNAYNYFGPNSDGDVEAIKQNSRYENDKLLDKELYLRNGVEIDLNPTRNNQLNNREGNDRMMKRSNHPHWAHLLNSLFENNPYSNGNDKLRREIKRDRSFHQTDRYYKPPKRPSKIVYIPLRQDADTYLVDERTRRRKHKKVGRIDQRLPSSNENDHPYNSIHKYADHIRAVKNLFYKQQKFGFLPPSPYTTVEPSHKRVFDGGYGLDINNNEKKENHKDKVKNIALDYYFGRFKPTNKTNEDFDYVYPDSEDVHTLGNIKDFVSKHKKVNTNPYRMVATDCEEGCIEIQLKSDDNFEKYLNIVIKILKDMIYTDKKELISYNWLLSTVDMESAVKKLIELTNNIEKGKSIHPLDLRLLNYVVYLYGSAKNIPENKLASNNKSNAFQLKDINYIVKSFLNLLRRRIALPRNKNKKKGHGNPIRLWYQYYIRKGDKDDNSTPVKNAKVLRSFKMFLMDLEDNMFELHNALKHLASITTYRAQNWYKDLKNIYLKSASKKELLEVILHLAASRLFSSIEETAKNAEDEDLYVNNNRDVVRRITNEFIFVLKILEVIKKINY